MSVYKENERCYESNFMHKFCSWHFYLRVKLGMDLVSAFVHFVTQCSAKKKKTPTAVSQAFMLLGSVELGIIFVEVAQVFFCLK